MTTQEHEEAACAQLLIEIAFLLPRGTDIRTHPISAKLLNYVDAVRSNAHNHVCPPTDDTELEHDIARMDSDAR